MMERRVIIENERKVCDEWNLKNPVGSEVVVTKDLGDKVESVTSSAAFVSESGHAVIWVDGIRGYYLLSRVSAIPDKQTFNSNMARTMTQDEWMEEGKRRFGPDIMKWKFKCPSCGIIISIQEYKDAGAPEGAVGFNCIGRYRPESQATPMLSGKQPCNYTSGGLIGISPLEIIFPNGKKDHYFDFAEAEA